MEAFRNSNPGIASRIGFTFHFPDYTPAELTEMFGRKMEKNGFLVNAGALEQVQRIMEYFSRLEDFGNGRFVDKVMDLVISRRSQRSYARRYNDISAQDIQVLWTDEDQSEEMRRRIAVHEAGHALVSRLLWPERKLAVISIQADAGSMGKVVGETEPGQNTESNLKAQLAVLFGGRNAERLVWGEHSTGCQMDMEQARQLASYMIRQVAMGELGVTTELDLLREADQRAEEALAAHKKELLQLADCLVEKGIIDGAEWEDRVP